MKSKKLRDKSSNLTFETFNKCLSKELSKNEYASYKNNPKFIHALKTVFSKNQLLDGDSKKKVSFSKTLPKKKSEKKYDLMQSATFKRKRSKSKEKSPNKVSLNNFNQFFKTFMQVYADQGYVEFGKNKNNKIIHVMETRISDDNDGKKFIFIFQKIN